MKKLTALFMTLIFVVINMCPAFAVSPEYEICGNSIIVLPAKEGEICNMDYELYTTVSTQKADAKFSISGNTNGIFMTESGKLFITNEASEGTITISALYDGKNYTKEVAIKKGLFEDFEGYEVGNMPQAPGWNKDRLGAICSDGHGKFLDGSANSYAVYEFSSDLATEDITLELDVFVSNDKKALFQILGAGNDKNNTGDYYIDYWLNSSLWLRTKYIEDGSSVSYRNLIQLDSDTWTKMKIQFNLVDNCYTVWVGSQKIIDNWKLNSNYSIYTFKKLILKGCIDNIKVYSGTPTTASVVTSDQMVTIPGDGRQTKLDLTASLVVDSDEHPGLIPEWELKSPYDGVYIDGNKLVVTSEATEGTVKLQATFGNLTAEKNVELAMPTIRLSTFGSNLEISALENTEYNISIYNPSVTTTLIDKFVSVKEVENNDADSTQNIITGLDGKATVSLSSLEAGKYNICVTDTSTGETSQIQYISLLNELLSDSSATSDNKFTTFLTQEGIDDAATVKDIYSSVNDKTYVISLMENDITNLPACASLVSVLEQPQTNSELNTFAKSALLNLKKDTSAIDLLSVCPGYLEATEAIIAENASSIDSLISAIRKHVILVGVKSSSDASGVKVFLESLDSDIYNNARPMEKEYIENFVYGIPYKSLEELKSAISDIDLSNVGLDCTLVGPSLVILPAKSGQMGSVKYFLYDNEVLSDANAKFTIAGGEYSGLIMLEDGTLLTSPNAKPGKVKVQAKHKNNIFEKEITLKAGYFNDFQSDKVGQVASGWEDRKSYVKKEADGNKYMDGKTDGQNARLTTEDYTSEAVTVEFDTLITEDNVTSDLWTSVLQMSSSTAGGKTGQFYFSHVARVLSGVPKLVTYYGADGNTLDSYKVIKNLEFNKWYKSKFVFDYSVPSYTLYIDDELMLKDYKFSVSATDYTLTKVIFGTFVDNLNIYSGDCGDISPIAPVQRVAVPLDGSKTNTKLSLSLSFAGNTYNNIPATWKLKENYNGVSISGNQLTVLPEAGTGSFEVTTTIAGVTINKSIEVYNPSFRINVDQNSLKISGQQNADYVISIYAPQNDEDLIDMFMLDTTSDTEGVTPVMYSMSANASGDVVLDLSDLAAGKYNIYVEKQNSGEKMHIVYFSKISELLADTEALESYKFEELLWYLEVDNADKACKAYYGLTNKAFAIEICDDNLYNFPAAVAVAGLLENTSNNTKTNEFAKTALLSLDIDAVAVDLLSANAIYTEVTNAVNAQGTTTLMDTIDAIKTNSILIGIKNVVNKKDAMVFLAQIDSAKYNGANSAQKVTIANEVAKRAFAAINDVKLAVDAVNLTVPNAGGGSGSGLSSVSTSTSIGGGVGTHPVVNVPQTPVLSSAIYTDVSSDFWAKDAIELLSQKGIITGYNGMFRPGDTLTRGEMAKIISVAANLGDGKCNFADVSQSDWFYPYVGAAFNAGLISGYDGIFNPHANVTRQDVAVIMYRLFGYKLQSADNVSFSDSADVADYAKNAVASLSNAGIINGYEDGTFKPKNSITRAEIAKLMSNCITLWEGESNE